MVLQKVLAPIDITVVGKRDFAVQKMGDCVPHTRGGGQTRTVRVTSVTW